MKTSLLVLVHGSPRPSANTDLFRTLGVIQSRGLYNSVRAGFLECKDPTIPDAIDQCVADGAASIICVPYFLHTGNHVCEDLPDLLVAARARHPGVEFLLAPFIGRSSRLTELLARRASEALDETGAG